MRDGAGETGQDAQSTYFSNVFGSNGAISDAVSLLAQPDLLNTMLLI
jgi:hypothetical protein